MVHKGTNPDKEHWGVEGIDAKKSKKKAKLTATLVGTKSHLFNTKIKCL
jgi:hypothetical protein